MQERKPRIEPSRSVTSLPRPFFGIEWPRELRQPVRALWNWHLSLQHLALETDPSVIENFASERERVLSLEKLRLIPKTVSDDAYKVVDQFQLPVELLADQLTAAERFYHPIRFSDAGEQDAFIQKWAIAHGRLLAHLADAAHSWQVEYVDALTYAFFMVGRLIELPTDISHNRIFIPESDLTNAKVTIQDLERGRVDESIRRLLWKQTIRIRDAFVRGMPLLEEIRPRLKISLKLWWHGGLEVLNVLERREFDVWTKPVVLSTAKRASILLESLLFRPPIRKR